MKTDKRDRWETLESVSEIFKNAFSILAIIIGGWWTYSKFMRVEAPSLEPRGGASSSLS